MIRNFEICCSCGCDIKSHFSKEISDPTVFCPNCETFYSIREVKLSEMTIEKNETSQKNLDRNLNETRKRN